MDMKLKRTVIPVVAVALAVLLVAPGCDKKNDKEDPKPANPGVTNNTGSNSGSNSQNSGNSNTPQTPQTPEQKTIVDKVKQRIKGSNGMAMGIHNELHKDAPDVKKLENWFAEAQELKKELEKLPDTDKEKKKLLEDVNLMIDASQAGIDYEMARKKATELDQTAAWKTLGTSVEKARKSYGATAKRYFENLKPDSYKGNEKKAAEKFRALAEGLNAVSKLGAKSTSSEVLKLRATIEELISLRNAAQEFYNKPDSSGQIDGALVSQIMEYTKAVENMLRKAESPVKELEKKREKMEDLRNRTELAI